MCNRKRKTYIFIVLFTSLEKGNTVTIIHGKYCAEEKSKAVDGLGISGYEADSSTHGKHQAETRRTILRSESS